jgi:hypothetical protein
VLGVSVRFMHLSAVNRCPATQRLPTRDKRALKFRSYVEARLFSFETDPLRRNPDGQKGSLRVEPSSTSDKRDDVFARALLIGGCPVRHPASSPLGPGCLRRVPGGVVLRKLSKLLSQEDA